VAPLEKGTPRAEAQSFVKKLTLEGAGLNAIQRILQDTGLGYNRAEISEDWHYYQAVARAQDVGRYTRKDRYPGPASIVPSRLPIADPYQALIRIERVDPRTGEAADPFFMYFGTDEPALVGVMEGQAWSEYEKEALEDPDKYPYEAVGATYMYTRQNTGW